MSRVNSIEEFLREIYYLSEKDKKISKKVTTYYRGESAEYENTGCQPGIFRYEGLIKNEHIMFKEFILRNPEEFEKDKLTIDKLTRMQHYGLPTRLLDITSNALMGLYFACEKLERDEEGIVYIFEVPNEKIKFYDSDTVSVLANLAKREKFDFPFNEEKNMDCFNNQKNIQFLLHNIKDEKPYFKDKIVPEHLNSVVCVKPLLNNKRIVRQQGAFFLFGNDKKNKYKPAEFKKSEIREEKVFIAGSKKEEIINNLETLGISRATVYPDLTDVANYLRGKYKGAI